MGETGNTVSVQAAARQVAQPLAHFYQVKMSTETQIKIRACSIHNEDRAMNASLFLSTNLFDAQGVRADQCNTWISAALEYAEWTSYCTSRTRIRPVQPHPLCIRCFCETSLAILLVCMPSHGSNPNVLRRLLISRLVDLG